jgi:hypothetical protein
MLQVIASLVLIALGMAVDALYQRKIRIAECNAYDTGYKQGKTEEAIKLEMLKACAEVQSANITDCTEIPTMAAPVSIPETFEERLRQHGRATVRIK